MICKPLRSSRLAIFRVMATLKTPKAIIFSNLQVAPRVINLSHQLKSGEDKLHFASQLFSGICYSYLQHDISRPHTASTSVTCKSLSSRELGLFRVVVLVTLKTPKTIIYRLRLVYRPCVGCVSSAVKCYCCTIYQLPMGKYLMV